MVMEATERRIIELCRDGAECAFDMLVDIYGKRLYSFIYGIVRNHEAADEILQETFLKTYTSVNQRFAGENLGNWLFKVAYRKCLDAVKREKRRRENEKRFVDLDADRAAQCDGVEARMLETEKAAQIGGAMLDLPEKQRAALSLFAVQGLSIIEISAVMGCSRGTVMSHLHRARRAMRENLAPLLKDGVLEG